MGEPTNPHCQSSVIPDAGQLPKVLRVRDIWALGVGIVVCGQYFGWNLGLKDNGPIAMLIASLLVCLLFTGWVLTLAELAVALPTAGGPMDYGMQAGGRWLGFLMGWSMFLECLFGGVATALASGGYIAFLLNPADPDLRVTVIAGIATIMIFLFLQAYGVREQARVLTWMIYAALLGLIVFWIAAASNFRWERIWMSPAIPENKGWQAVIDAIPFALWWLIIIEGAALAAEETHRPHRTLPRGLTLAVLTVTIMVVLTTITACGAHSSQEIAVKGERDVEYPLAEVIRHVPAGSSPLLLYGFGIVAICGLVASYHGLLFSAGRQLFALGRAGFVPASIGRVHLRRETPIASLAVCSVIAAGFVASTLFFKGSIMTLAVLVAGFAALVLYILSMICLLRLRKRNPLMFRAYRAPFKWGLPAAIIVLSVIALIAYPRMDRDGVLPLACGLYAGGAILFLAYRRNSGIELKNMVTDPGTAQPERIAVEGSVLLHRIAGTSLVISIAGAIAIALMALGIGPVWLRSQVSIAVALLMTALAVVLLSVVALRGLR